MEAHVRSASLSGVGGGRAGARARGVKLYDVWEARAWAQCQWDD